MTHTPSSKVLGPTPNSLLRSADAARILNVSAETLRLWERDGKLPFAVTRTDGGQRRYPAVAVHDLAERIKAGSGDAAQLLASTRGMTMVPTEREIAPGLLELQDGEGGVGHFGAPQKNHLVPRKPMVPDAPIAWTDEQLLEAGKEAVTVAYQPDGTACMAGGVNHRLRCPSAGIGFAILTGSHVGRIVTMDFDFDGEKRGELAKRWVQALTGKECSDTEALCKDGLALMPVMERMYQMTIIEVAPSPLDFPGNPPALRHGGIGEIAQIGDHPLRPISAVERPSSSKEDFTAWFDSGDCPF